MRLGFPRVRSATPFLAFLSATLACATPHPTDSLGVERIDTASALPLDKDHSKPERVPRTITGIRFEAQAGVVRWKWNEVVPGRSQLEELGFVPVFLASGTWWKGPVRLGASVELLSGAIAYDGYLQDRFGGSLVPYESNTYYVAVTPTLTLQLRSSGVWEWIRPSVSLARPWWRRTIDSEVDRSPGRFGYVEVWSVLGSGFGLELERTYRQVHALSILGEILVPLSTSERIGPTHSAIELKPQTRNGSHWRARFVHRQRFVVELDALRTGFDESDPVDLGGGTGLQVYQPESHLDRFAWKVGMIF